MTVCEILHRPAEVCGIDPKHGRALAHRRREEEDFFVRQVALQAIDQIELGPYGPYGAGRCSRDGLDDEFRRPSQIRPVHDILMTFRMHNDLAGGIPLAEMIDVDRLKHLMDAAMP